MHKKTRGKAKRAVKFDPKNYPNIVFTNWFERGEHIEDEVGTLTDIEFQDLKYTAQDDLADSASEMFFDWLADYKETLREERKDATSNRA